MAANFNNSALNALFNAVTNEEFKKISSTKTAKEAWTILQKTYEGTKAVKDSKFQRLTTSFEEIKMEEDESFDEFFNKWRTDIQVKAQMINKYRIKMMQGGIYNVRDPSWEKGSEK